ncbi:MAG: histidinol-phosphatase [Clostridia bacterium]|nr:histidinol-phosphatase [Clostridia bacterium]
MKYNYHTHTYRCNHAGGSDLEYARAAYDNGFVEIGFSDHVPQIGFKGIFDSWFRMAPEETAAYFDSINKLKEEFDGKMNILSGFEVEYYPKHFQALCEHIAPFAPDYLILGQHFSNNEYDGEYLGDSGCHEEALWQYAQQIEDALKTGLFTYLAHPDLPNFRGSEETLQKVHLRLCETAKAAGVPIECNLLGIKGNRWYPKKSFFEIAAKVGCPVVLGLDAHSPDAFNHEKEEKIALDLLRECGIIPIDKPIIRRPF